MLDVHSRLHRHERTADPLSYVAAQLMADMRVLCLDEFFVTDVADATMLNRLFGQMWDRGLVLVATSNRCSHHPMFQSSLCVARELITFSSFFLPRVTLREVSLPLFGMSQSQELSRGKQRAIHEGYCEGHLPICLITRC